MRRNGQPLQQTLREYMGLTERQVRMTNKAVKRKTFIYLIVLLMAIGSSAQTVEHPPAACRSIRSSKELGKEVLHPFWLSHQIHREPVLFEVQQGASVATATLMFVPTHIVSVTSMDEATTYKAGKDYIWLPGTNVLQLPPTSRIPSKTWAQLHPPIGSPMTLGKLVGGDTSLLFSLTGKLFHELQVSITYDHKQKWAGVRPEPAISDLSRTIHRLRAGKPIKLVVLGDSISTGAGASSASGINESPCQPSYPELVVDGLKSKYKSSIILKNLSVGGKTALWGSQIAPRVAAEMPDLVIVAFGMNDASGRTTPAAYIEHIKAIIAEVRKTDPSADFILVATMSGNPEWSGADPPLYLKYRDALETMTGPGIGLADMTSMSLDILKDKKFVDITANGVNHPNDFGHLVYAQVILQLFH